MENRTERQIAKFFQDLIVSQKAHLLVSAIYRFADGFPRKEIYGLTSQFRHAAFSIPANIAEGFTKRSRSDKAGFMKIAQGSLAECRNYLISASDLGYGDSQKLMVQLDEDGKLLAKYHDLIMALVK